MCLDSKKFRHTIVLGVLGEMRHHYASPWKLSPQLSIMYCYIIPIPLFSSELTWLLQENGCYLETSVICGFFSNHLFLLLHEKVSLIHFTHIQTGNILKKTPILCCKITIIETNVIRAMFAKEWKSLLKANLNVGKH